ncbi:unnamed protein product [Umbelopsis ramanniana]
MSDSQYDNYQQVERLDDNARREIWSKPSGQHMPGSLESQPIAFSTPRKQPDSKISKSAPSKSHRSSFGTRRYDPFHLQEHPYYPGASSPNWAAGTFASPEASPVKSRRWSGRNSSEDFSSTQNGRKRSRQGSTEMVKPSSYLSIPPMVPSELALEPTHHPSRQVDWLAFDDLGIDKLFDTPLASADKAIVQGISQRLPDAAVPDEDVGNESISKIMPPTVPSSLAMKSLLNPSPSCLDWASWEIDDIGLEKLMPSEDDLSESSSFTEWINRTHKSEQRPIVTSARHEQANQDSSWIPILEPRPHTLGINPSTMFDSQDTSGDFDKSASTTGRVHDTIQRPKVVQSDWHLGSEGSVKDLPPEINVQDSWTTYMAFKAAQERPQQHLRYESPGSLAQEKFDSQERGSAQQSGLAQSTLVDIEEAVEQRKLKKREMREENRSKDWADEMDDDQLETLFPQQYGGSTDRFSQQELGAESKVPTWTSTSSYGINAPYSLAPFSFESNAKETAFPTAEYVSKNWMSESSSSLSSSLHGVKDDTDADSQDPQLHLHHKLHGLVDTVASSVGAVAGTAVGAISYLFGDNSHATEDKSKETSYSSNTTLNAGDQKYAKETEETEETEGVKAIATVPDSQFANAEEQLFVAKQEIPDLSLGHVDDDSHVVNLHPSLLRPTDKRELSSEQPIGSSDHLSYPATTPQLELSQNLQNVVDRTTDESDFSGDTGSQYMQVVPDEEGSIGLVKSAPEDANETNNDDEIRDLFNDDPDSVRQSFKSDAPHKTTLDDRRQVWGATVSSALGQAASTLGLQSQSKEKSLDLENYHVVDSGYKPSTYEPGRNQFDSDFENWKHDSPSRTPFNEAETKHNETIGQHVPVEDIQTYEDAFPDQNSMTISSLPLGKPITYELGRKEFAYESANWKHDSPSMTLFNEAERKRSEDTDEHVPTESKTISNDQQALPHGKPTFYNFNGTQFGNDSGSWKHDSSSRTPFNEADNKGSEATDDNLPTKAKIIEVYQETLPDQNSMTISSLPLGQPITYEPGRSQFESGSENWKHDSPSRTPINESENLATETTAEHAPLETKNIEGDQQVVPDQNSMTTGSLPHGQSQKYEPGRNELVNDPANWKHDSPTRTPFNEAEAKQSEATSEQVPFEPKNIASDQQVVPDQNSTTTSSLSSGKPTWDRAEFHDPSDYMKGTESHMQQRQSQQADESTSRSRTARGPTGWIRRKWNKRRARAAR